MNSFIKKIAFVMSGVLAVGFLAAAPAQAVTAIAITTSTGGAGTSVSPYTVKVPADNTVNTSSGGNSEFLTVTVTVDTAGTPVTFSATNAKIVQAAGTSVFANSGVGSVTVTPASTTAVAYVYTTSTTAGTITVVAGGTTATYHVKGLAGDAYNVALSVPSNVSVSTTVTANAFVTDVFGNPTTGTVGLKAVNATLGSATAASTSTVGKYEFSLALPSTTGTAAVSASLSGVTDVDGLAKAVTVSNAFITISDKDATIASLTAELAKAKADLEAEKTARAADKAAADKALADAKAASDKALGDAKAAADKAALDATNALAAATAQTLELAKTINKLKAKYNKMAKKYGFKLI